MSHQRSVRSRSRDESEILRGDAVPRDQLEVVASIMRLTKNKPCLVPEAAIIQNLNAHSLHLSDNVRVVDLAKLNRLKHGFGNAALVKSSLCLLREALAKDPAVMKDGYWLGAKPVG